MYTDINISHDKRTRVPRISWIKPLQSHPAIRSKSSRLHIEIHGSNCQSHVNQSSVSLFRLQRCLASCQPKGKAAKQSGPTGPAADDDVIIIIIRRNRRPHAVHSPPAEVGKEKCQVEVVVVVVVGQSRCGAGGKRTP